MFDTEIVTLTPITVIGPAIRTNNQIEATEDGVILKLHEAFVKNNMSSTIDDKVDDHIIGLYRLRDR